MLTIKELQRSLQAESEGSGLVDIQGEGYPKQGTPRIQQDWNRNTRTQVIRSNSYCVLVAPSLGPGSIPVHIRHLEMVPAQKFVQVELPGGVIGP